MKQQLLKLQLLQHGTATHSDINIPPTPFHPSHSPLPPSPLTHCREDKMETHTEPPHKNTLLADLERMDAGEIEETEVHNQNGITQMKSLLTL